MKLFFFLFLKFIIMIGSIIVPSKDVYTLILWTSEHLPYRAQGTLQMWLGLRILRWEDYPSWSKRAQSNHESSETTIPGCGQRETIEEGSEVHYLVCFAAEEWAQAMGWASRRWKRQGNGFLPGASRKECNPIGTWVLAQWDPCQTYNL